MDEKMMEKNDEIEIDLQRLLGALLKRSWLIGIVAVVVAVAAFLGTYFFITPQYQSSAMFYVNNSSLSLGDMSMSIESSDITASRNLVKSYIVILRTRETLNMVVDYAGVKRTAGQVRNMISAAAVDNTEIFQVVVTSPNPEEAKKLADAIAYVLPKRIGSIIEGTSAKVVDSAVRPVNPSSPNYSKNTLIGFLGGAVLMALLIVVMELLDIAVRTEEDITRGCAYPVLASVPDMAAPEKPGRYYYRSYRRRDPKPDAEPVLVGSNISFAASEAYKLLRTKLQFSFADEGGSRVIGVSSALTGEGKSLSAVNLAFSMSQLGKRVLLIGCDMRRPSMAKKLPIQQIPGLSDFLAGQAGAENLIQVCGLPGSERAFHVIAAGRTPPNPIELLSSTRMEKMVEKLRGSYDYIILDLPPVCEVSDALAVARITDGMLLVVRQNQCDRHSLTTTVRQFEFVGSRILGVVFNCVGQTGTRYGKYRYRYYRKYYKQAAKEDGTWS